MPCLFFYEWEAKGKQTPRSRGDDVDTIYVCFVLVRFYGLRVNVRKVAPGADLLGVVHMIRCREVVISCQNARAACHFQAGSLGNTTTCDGRIDLDGNTTGIVSLSYLMKLEYVLLLEQKKSCKVFALSYTYTLRRQLLIRAEMKSQ